MIVLLCLEVYFFTLGRERKRISGNEIVWFINSVSGEISDSLNAEILSQALQAAAEENKTSVGLLNL